jgi:hypothetical protein
MGPLMVLKIWVNPKGLALPIPFVYLVTRILPIFLQLRFILNLLLGTSWLLPYRTYRLYSYYCSILSSLTRHIPLLPPLYQVLFKLYKIVIFKYSFYILAKFLILSFLYQEGFNHYLGLI